MNACVTRTGQWCASAILFILLSINIQAAQRSVIDAREAAKMANPKSHGAEFKEDGDIHIFDVILNRKNIDEDERRKMFKTDSVHEGIWIMSYDGELPEDISFRVIHIGSDGSRRDGTRRPTIGHCKEGSPEKALQDANAAYDVANFESALPLYMKVFNTWPQHRIAPYAMFMAGQCLCALQRHKESVALHKLVAVKYPTSKSSLDALFRVACVTAGHLNQPEEGIKLFSAVLNKYPSSFIAEDCLFSIAALHLVNKQTEQAAAEFLLLLRSKI